MWEMGPDWNLEKSLDMLMTPQKPRTDMLSSVCADSKIRHKHIPEEKHSTPADPQGSCWL